MNRLIILLLCACSFVPVGASDSNKLTASDYIRAWKDEAVYQMVVHRVPASITLAQGMLESGNGNSRLAMEGNNHFGIKCHSDWSGKTILEDDETRGECFRKYRDARDSFDDHSVFLKRKRYSSLFELEITDYKAWAHGLKQCGYATNPNYPQALIRLIETHQLAQYDLIGLEFIGRNKIPHREHAAEIPAGLPEKPASRDRQRHKPSGFDPDAPNQINLISGRQIMLSSNHIKYILAKGGDTPESIAQDLDLGPWQIRKYNDLKNGQSISEGAIVYLQPKRNKATEKSHTVSAGETVESISQQYGIKTKKLIKYNSIKEERDLVPGTVLRLR